jgi:hypothetical protein
LLRRTSAATSSVILPSSLLRCLPGRACPRLRRGQRDLDVDLDVGGVDAGGIVDGIGVDAPAGERELDAPALGDGEVGALADHLGAQLAAVTRIASLARSPTSASVSVEART